jgi:hypothetical protein
VAKNKADVVKKQRAYLKQKKKNMPQKVKLTNAVASTNSYEGDPTGV